MENYTLHAIFLYKKISNGNNLGLFHFIVGNPPYIRIQHLEVEQRQYVQAYYHFCHRDSTDIYIAFFELCYNLLNTDGIAGLITPNTYFYTETAIKLRTHFALKKCIKQITNYADIQLFDNATTYSAITIFNKKQNNTFLLQYATDRNNFKIKNINSNLLLNKTFWQLSTEEIKNGNGKKLKDICKIHVGIITLCDKAYIFKAEIINQQYMLAHTRLKGKVKIETDILKPIIKGSTLKSSEDPITEFILFPFKNINNKHQIISEKELQKKFPLCLCLFIFYKK